MRERRSIVFLRSHLYARDSRSWVRDEGRAMRSKRTADIEPIRYLGFDHEGAYWVEDLVDE